MSECNRPEPSVGKGSPDYLDLLAEVATLRSALSAGAGKQPPPSEGKE